MRIRALIIASFGPALQAVGLLWALVNALVAEPRFTFRYVVFDPAHLVILVGVLLSVVCIPIALEVAAASPEEVELELFEPDPARRTADEPAEEIPIGSWEAIE
jgi:hypothetical protein